MDIKTPAFEGPMDLLLHLIRKNEINIHDIPMALITREYLDALKVLPRDMYEISEFLVMAATLLEIKSKMLLPTAQSDTDEIEDDPREELAQKLLAHERAKELAEILSTLTPIGEKVKGPGDPELIAKLTPDTTPGLNTPLDELWTIFTEILSRKADRRDTIRAGYGTMAKDRFTMPEKLASLKQLLLHDGKFSLRAVLTECLSKSEMVVTFLALLELIRQGMALARQDVAFGDVHCVAAAA